MIKHQAGTPGYVSPEVLERKAHGKPVDMWAMGVVLYMLLGGYPPFYQSEEDSRAMYRRILLGNYQFHPEYW
jgi:calcium/calmodulin-dependent protein kinase I